MEEHYSSNNSEPTSIIPQLREKVRQQANRLRGLEQYRILCEERVLDLCPGHPLPVQPEHLGLQQSGQQELFVAQQKISRLEKQLHQPPMSEPQIFPHPSAEIPPSHEKELYSRIYYSLHTSLKDKAAVEESLRSEVLISEEQRSYIEVLKQALEVKMEEVGVHGQSVDDLVQLASTKSQGDLHRKELNKVGSYLAELEQKLYGKVEENENLLQEREELEANLREAGEALALAEEEAKQLEEEKSSLIDYIEEHNQKTQQREQLILQNNAKIQELENRRKETTGNLTTLQGQLTAVELAKTQLKGELETLQDDIAGERRKTNALNRENTDLNDQLEYLNVRNEVLQSNNTALGETVREVQEELECGRAEAQDSKQELKALRSHNVELEQELETLQQDNKRIQGELGTLEGEAESLKEEVLRSEENLRDAVSSENQKTQKLEKEYSDYIEKHRKTSELQESQSKKIEINSQTIASLNSNIESLKQYTDSVVSQLSTAEEGKNALQRELSNSQERARSSTEQTTSLATELNKEISLHKATFNENTTLARQIEALNSKLYDSINLLTQQEQRIAEIQTEVAFLQSSLSSAESELKEKSKELRSSTSTITELRSKTSQLTGQVAVLNEKAASLAECHSIIAAFCENISSYEKVPSPTATSLVLNWTTQPNSVADWLQLVTQELISLTSQLGEFQEIQALHSQQLRTSQNELESLKLGEITLKDNKQNLQVKLNTTEGEKANSLRELEQVISYNSNIQAELSSLRNEHLSSIEENSRLKDQLRLLTSDTVQWKHTTETDIFTIKSVEERANLLQKEKKELEYLVNKIYCSIPSADMQTLFAEMMKTRAELETTERERIRIENQLLRSEADMRACSRANQRQEAMTARKEVDSLRNALTQCEIQIQSHKRKTNNLENELKEIELIERRRYALHLDTEKNYVSLQNQYDTVKRKGDQMYVEDSAFNSPGSYFDKLSTAKSLLEDLKTS